MTMSEIMEVADNPEGTSIKPAREPDKPLAESAAAEASGHI
jgi:hypothetical protein